VLDALGDFKLAGVAIQGSFKLHRSGHDLHKKILAELFSNPDYYEVIEGASSMSAESPAGIAYGSEWIPSIA
jgi:UDP-3-O-acyl-N-acetylglucosamine deacetylase